MKSVIGRQIFIALVMIQLLSLVALVGSYFYTVKEELSRLTETTAELAVVEILKETEAYFAPAVATVEGTVGLFRHEILSRDAPEQLDAYFLDRLRENPGMAGIFVGWPDGGFNYMMRNAEHSVGGFRSKRIEFNEGQRQVTYQWRDSSAEIILLEDQPEDNYDPRARPWYKSALTAEGPVWSKPYIFFTSSNPGMTVAQVVSDKGGPIAVIGADFEISDISRLLSQVNLGTNGLAVIVNQEGQVLAHPRESILSTGSGDEALKFRQIADYPGALSLLSDELESRFEPAGNQAPSVAIRDWDGSSFYVVSGTSEIVDWPWLVGVIVPESSFQAIGESENLLFIIIAVLLLAVGVAFAFIFAGGLGSQFLQLKKNAQLARGGNFELMSSLEDSAPEIKVPAEVLREAAERMRGRGT